jgi:hypothetical protein
MLAREIVRSVEAWAICIKWIMHYPTSVTAGLALAMTCDSLRDYLSTAISGLQSIVTSPVDMSHREGDRESGDYVVAHAEPLIQ